MPYGRVYPDARAVLVIGARLIDLIVEWDRGRTNARTLRAKLPHYLAWAGSPAGQDGLVLFVTGSVRREQQIDAIVRQQATGRSGRPGPRSSRPAWRSWRRRGSSARSGPGAWTPRGASRS